MAKSVDIDIEGKSHKEIALELYDELERTYTQVEGEIPFAKRVPAKTLETWRKHNIVPRGAMREIMELMHRSHMGVDQHYENITQQCSRTALADGWGGSMVATEIADPGPDNAGSPGRRPPRRCRNPGKSTCPHLAS